MNRSEMVQAVADKVDVSKSLVDDILTSFFTTILPDALSRGEDVAYTGWATFKSVQRKARVCRNPKTGGKVNVPARQAVRFQPGANLKKAVAAKKKAAKK